MYFGSLKNICRFGRDIYKAGKDYNRGEGGKHVENMNRTSNESNIDYFEIPRKYRFSIGWTTAQIDRADLKIYRNSHYSSQKLCLKVICCEDNEDRFRRAVKECEITEILRGNPGIVWLLDYDIDPEKKVVALLEEGEKTLQEHLCSEYLYRSTMVHIGTGILDSLIQIQKAGFLYLDIHPGNIYYNEKRIKIGDFGSVIKLEEAEQYHELTGVKNFMAPEVWKDRTYSVQSVIYNVGMVLYWILNHCTPPFLPLRTKQEAFEKRMSGDPFPVPQCIQKYPGEMTDFYQCILKMTSYDPENRYKTFEEARHDLALIGYDYFLKELEEGYSEVRYLAGIGECERTVLPRFYSDPERT